MTASSALAVSGQGLSCPVSAAGEGLSYFKRALPVLPTRDDVKRECVGLSFHAKLTLNVFVFEQVSVHKRSPFAPNSLWVQGLFQF